MGGSKSEDRKTNQKVFTEIQVSMLALQPGFRAGTGARRVRGDHGPADTLLSPLSYEQWFFSLSKVS